VTAAVRAELAPAKVNLTLLVHGRRPDGYHELESLVVFADVTDALTLDPSLPFGLTVGGPTAQVSGPIESNLVIRAARELASRIPDLKLGAFDLAKHLPAAGGIGGGSADAAAALRLLARLNGLSLDDRRLIEAARAVGADVPVCLESQPRMMRGAGERLGPVLALPRLNAVLVNPGLPVATEEVFAELGLDKGQTVKAPPHVPVASALKTDTLLALLQDGRNDLQEPAIRRQPEIAAVIAALQAQPDCRLARMSGSGATCFGLFPTLGAVFDAVRNLRREHRNWWIQPATLGGLEA